MSLPPRLDAKDILAHLNSYSRAPFREFLVTLLDGAPDKETVAEWAKKSPDRYAQAVAIYGRLSGFTEKTEIDVSVNDFSGMSDSELVTRHAELEKALRRDDVEGVDIPLASRTPQGSA